MHALEYLGEIDKPQEKIKSQIMVNIIEGRDYYKSNVDTYVTVEIPPYFLNRTPTKKTSTSPSYFNVTASVTFSLTRKFKLILNIIDVYNRSSVNTIA